MTGSLPSSSGGCLSLVGGIYRLGRDVTGSL